MDLGSQPGVSPSVFEAQAAGGTGLLSQRAQAELGADELAQIAKKASSVKGS